MRVCVKALALRVCVKTLSFSRFGRSRGPYRDALEGVGVLLSCEDSPVSQNHAVLAVWRHRMHWVEEGSRFNSTVFELLLATH